MVSDQLLQVGTPTEMGVGEIIHSHLKMSARGVDAAQHQLADQFGAGNLQRAITAWNPRNHIYSVHSQGIQQIELQRSDSCGLENKVHRSNRFLDPVCGDFAAINVLPADSL